MGRKPVRHELIILFERKKFNVEEMLAFLAKEEITTYSAKTLNDYYALYCVAAKKLEELLPYG